MSLSRLPLMLALTVVAGGCVSTDPMRAWQQTVEDYVQTEGDGDPSVLRLVPVQRCRHDLAPARIAINKLGLSGWGLPIRRAKRDVVGFLVGTEVVRTQRWYVFLVGVLGRDVQPRYGQGTVVAPPIVESIRLSAFCRHGGGFEWVDGLPDRAALALYVNGDSMGSGADRASSPPAWRYGFPQPDDRLAVTRTETELWVAEQRSGACWVLRWPE